MSSDPMHSRAPQTAAMDRCLELAGLASAAGDVPVGALVADRDGRWIGQGFNRREADADPTAHAEILALRNAGESTGRWNLAGCTLVVTLEPCVMCAGALVAARVSRLVIGAWDDKAGACGSVWDLVRDRRANHWVEVVSGVRAAECADILSQFFAEQRG